MNQHVVYTADSVLPDGLRMGRNSRIVAKTLIVGADVVIADDVTLAGDRIALGDGVRIAAQGDIRSSLIEIGARSEIGARCRVLSADHFRVGTASRISADCHLLCRSFLAGDFLYLADHCSVGWGGTKESTARVRLGDRVALGPHNVLNANCEIELEDQVGTGSFVTFWTHGYHFGHSILDGYTPAFQKIKVHGNVWLGYHVTVLPGVEIGQNSIVAACSVVARTMPADKLIGGTPAKVLRDLNAEPLPAEAADRVLRDLLLEWRDALGWKGVEVSSALADEFIAQQGGAQPETYVFMPTEGSPLPSAPAAAGCDRTIWISVADRPDLRASLRPEDTLFECRSGRLSGRSTPLSEDLRDFLRRHTLPCGTETVFSSIEPPLFQRLREL